MEYPVITELFDIDPRTVRTRTYWALGKDRWSIALDQSCFGMKPGKVIAWADAEDLVVATPRFHVNVVQHRNALAGVGARGTKRNVVAWVVGWIKDTDQFHAETRVTFHWPDERSVFHVVDTGAPIRDADVAVFRTVRDEAGKAHGKVYVG